MPVTRPARVLRRLPREVLRPFVEMFWAIEPANGSPWMPGAREHVLPTGQMHLAFRISGGPLQLFDGTADREGHLVGDAVVGGARADYYVRDVSAPAASVGVQFRAGAAEALFGVPADRLAGRHTPLDDLWPAEAGLIREQLAEITMPHLRIDLLESILTAHLSLRRTVHPAVRAALERLRRAPSVRHMVEGSGYSHRALITLFRRSVGLTPKEYCRVLRLQRVLADLSRPRGSSLAETALDAGYSDQPHFSREFRSMAGVTPGAYRRESPVRRHHLGIDSDLFKTAGRALP